MGDYSYVRKITIDNTKVSETDAEFAILLNLTAAGSGVIADLKTVGNGGKIENTANGGASGSYTIPADLTFRTTADMTEAGASLDFEIEFYDAASGALIAWVQSGVNSGADVVFYMIFGNSDVSTSQEDVSGTWDSNFKGVYHFSDASGGLVDSTSNGKDLTEHGAPTYRQSGKVGYSISFDGSDDYFRLDSFIDISALSAIMISGWIKPTSGTVPVGCEIGTRKSGRVCVRPHTNDLDTILAILGETEYHYNYPANNIVDAWTHFAATYAGPGTVSGTYKVNNSDEGAFTTVGTPTFAELTGAAADRLTIAAGATLTTDDVINSFMTGEFCEVRISNVVRSANWISTVYANQNAPDTFYGVGGLEILQSAVGTLTFVGVQVKKTKTPKAGALTFIGTSIERAEKSLAGALSSAGVLVGKAEKALAGAQTYAGTLVGKGQKYFSGALTYIGVVTKETHLARTILAGALTSSGVFIGKAKKVLVGAPTFVGTSLRTMKFARSLLTGALTYVGVVRGKAKKVLAGALTLSGVQIGKARKFLAGALTEAGALRRSAAKTLVGAFSNAGTVVTWTVGDVILLVGVIGYTGDLYRKAKPTLRGSITPSGIISRFVHRILAGALSFVSSLLRVIPQPVTLTLAPRSTAFTLSTRSTSLVLASRSTTLTLPSRGG